MISTVVNHQKILKSAIMCAFPQATHQLNNEILILHELLEHQSVRTFILMLTNATSMISIGKLIAPVHVYGGLAEDVVSDTTYNFGSNINLAPVVEIYDPTENINPSLYLPIVVDTLIEVKKTEQKDSIMDWSNLMDDWNHVLSIYNKKEIDITVLAAAKLDVLLNNSSLLSGAHSISEALENYNQSDININNSIGA